MKLTKKVLTEMVREAVKEQLQENMYSRDMKLAELINEIGVQDFAEAMADALSDSQVRRLIGQVKRYHYGPPDEDMHIDDRFENDPR